MSRKLSVVLLSIWMFCLLFMAALLLTPSEAAHASIPAGTEVVASDLDSPRGLAFGPDGALYIVEAGIGGDGPCISTEALGEVCYGPTGAVSRVLEDGTQETFVAGLPSLIVTGTTEAIGPQAVGFDGSGDPYLLIGLATDPAQRAALGAPGANFGQLGSIAGGTWSAMIDISAYEGTSNPDGGSIDTNPFAFMFEGDAVVVADAGANALLHAEMDGTITTLSVFPTMTVEGPGGTPVPMQAVPTSVMAAAEGGYYVSQLTGFPFPVGGASIFHVPAGGGDPTVHHTGFTNIVGTAPGPDGSYYVLEITTNGLLSGDPTGALIRVAEDGTQEVILTEGLMAPAGLTVGPDDAVYISNNGLAPGTGEVIRVVVSPTSVTLDTMSASSSRPPYAAIMLIGLISLTGAALFRRHLGI